MTLDFNEGATIHNISLSSHFSTFSNKLWENANISWAAKGLMGFILSRPKNWKVLVWQLSEIYIGGKKGNKRDGIRSMLIELRDAGYVIYTKHQDAKGKWVHSYHVYPMPAKDFQKMFPEPDQPALDDPALGNPALLTNTELTNTELNKKDRYKKESINRRVPNSPPTKQPLAPDRDDSIDSIPFHRKGDSIDPARQELDEFLVREKNSIKCFRKEIIARWVKKHNPKYVMDTMKYFLYILATQKKPIPNPEAWMEMALKNNYVSKFDEFEVNKKYAEEIKEKLNLSSLKINKRYCQDVETGQDFQYKLPSVQFKENIDRFTEKYAYYPTPVVEKEITKKHEVPVAKKNPQELAFEYNKKLRKLGETEVADENEINIREKGYAIIWFDAARKGKANLKHSPDQLQEWFEGTLEIINNIKNKIKK